MILLVSAPKGQEQTTPANAFEDDCLSYQALPQLGLAAKTADGLSSKIPYDPVQTDPCKHLYQTSISFDGSKIARRIDL